MYLPAPSLFRAYDVRGIVGETLDAADFIAIGHAFASHVADECQTRTPLILLMRDGRASSPNLAEAMIEGMLRAGARVLDGGVGPTPMCYFGTHHLNADGSIMITGSHNPPAHNGAKFMCDGKSLYGAALASLRERIARNNLLHSRGQREEVDILEEYLFELRKIMGDAPLPPIAWDAGNGVAGLVVEELLKHSKTKHAKLFLDVDSNFPNHHPDPAEEKNMQALRAAIQEDSSLAMGVAFDGDGDRMGAVDDKGRILSPDHTLMLLADEVLANHPGATIIADVKTSDQFFARVKAKGGTPLMWMTGHAHIKTKLATTDAKFAGEASGHIFFADEYFGYDDGPYAALRLIRIVAKSGKKLSELVDALPPIFASPEIRIDCPDDRKFEVVEAIAAALAEQGATVNLLDGVRVSMPQGWWLVRASNTQAALVARAEGANAQALTQTMHAMHTALKAQGIDISASASH